MYDEVQLAAVPLRDQLQSLTADQSSDPSGRSRVPGLTRQLEVSEAFVRYDRQLLGSGDCLDGGAEGADVRVQSAAIGEHHVCADTQGRGGLDETADMAVTDSDLLRCDGGVHVLPTFSL